MANLQDVVLMDYSCNPPNQVRQMGAPLICPNNNDGTSAFEVAWKDNPDMRPVVISVGAENRQQAWWQTKRQQGGGSALTAICKQNKARFAADAIPGRIGIIGFSQGCSGVGEMLRSADDSLNTDFVYACDGMHGQLDTKTGGVTLPSIEPWINFAVRAAMGQCMMVVTHTEIVPANQKCPPPAGFSQCGVASTTQTAQALLSAVKQQLGYKQIAPRMIPRGLIGQAGYAPVPPNNEYWMSHVNSPSKAARVYAPWPGGESGQPPAYYEVLGNLIVVGFTARSPDDPAAPSGSQSAHIFQAWWVTWQVINEVLACRWAAKCDSFKINPEDASAPTMASGEMRTMSARVGTAGGYVDRRFPSVLQTPNAGMTRTLGGLSGLGAIGPGCVVEGRFSNLFSSLDDFHSGAPLFAGAPAWLTAQNALLGAGVGLFGYALYKYTQR